MRVESGDAEFIYSLHRVDNEWIGKLEKEEYLSCLMRRKLKISGKFMVYLVDIPLVYI